MTKRGFLATILTLWVGCSDKSEAPTDTDTDTDPRADTDTTPSDTGATGHTGGPGIAGEFWVSDPVAVDGLRQVVGSPTGWAILSDTSGLVAVQRVAADGSLVDAAAVELFRSSTNFLGLWTGSEFAVVAATGEDYYELTAALDVVRISPTAPVAPVAQRLAEGLGWPRNLAGACDGAGACTVGLVDLHWLTSAETLRLSFDAGGSTAGLAPIAGGETRHPLAGVRDADRTLLLLSAGANLPGLLWLPDDAALPPESPTEVTGATELAAGADGVVLLAWTHYEPDGDSGLPLGEWSVRAQRFQFGVGALDAAPIELGPGRLSDVAFTGATFVVALVDEETSHLVRVDADGVAGERVAVPQGPTDYGVLAAGAPGHLLWGRTGAEGDHFFVRVEIDVPEGGACAADASCQSGVCDLGVCAAP